MVSIIVPVYQVEKYLQRCVDSILCQSYRDIQVILVDDGSKDTSGKICDQYAARDTRVQVIHKTNGGLSDARNAGLDVFIGQYVMFVDGDDCIHPQTVQLLLDGIEQYDADIACCNIDHFTEKPKAETPRGQFYLVDIWQQMCDTPEFSVCNRLFRRELFSQVRFPVGRLFEDQFVILKLLGGRKVVCTDDRLYFYFQRFDGLSKQRIYPETYDLLDASLALLRDIPRNQKACRRAFTAITVERIGLLLGNVFYQDGQYRNCKIDTVVQWVRTYLPELAADASFWNGWMLRQVAKGKGKVFHLLVKTYLKPTGAVKNKIKRVLKIG